MRQFLRRIFPLAFRGISAANLAVLAFQVGKYLTEGDRRPVISIDQNEIVGRVWDPLVANGWTLLLDCWLGQPAVFPGSANGDTPEQIAFHGVTFCCPPGASYSTPASVDWWRWGGPQESGAFYYANWWKYHDTDIFLRARYKQSIRFRIPKATYDASPDKRVAGWQTIRRSTLTGGDPLSWFGPLGTPYFWPYIFPEHVSPFAPMPPPQTIPWRWVPRIRPRRPDRAPQEGPSRGNKPDRDPVAPPVARPPNEDDAPFPAASSGGNRRPPDDKDKKDRRGKNDPPTSKAGKAAVAIAMVVRSAAEAGMEAAETIDALYWSLPASMRSKKERTALQRLRQVMANALWIDWKGHWYTNKKGERKWSPGAAERLLNNAAEDMGFGLLGKGLRKQAQEIYDRTGYNVVNPVSRTLGNIARMGKMGGVKMN